MIVCIFLHHLWKTKLLYIFLRHRHAYQTLAVHRHKVDVFCCGKFCRTDEIALILSVLIICDKYYFSCTKLIKCFFYCVEFHILYPFSYDFEAVQLHNFLTIQPTHICKPAQYPCFYVKSRILPGNLLLFQPVVFYFCRIYVVHFP